MLETIVVDFGAYGRAVLMSRVEECALSGVEQPSIIVPPNASPLAYIRYTEWYTCEPARTAEPLVIFFHDVLLSSHSEGVHVYIYDPDQGLGYTTASQVLPVSQR